VTRNQVFSKNLVSFCVGYFLRRPLGQLAKTLKKTKSEMLDTLDKLGISIADYDLVEDLDTVETLMK
jgi:hypothetical protein